MGLFTNLLSLAGVDVASLDALTLFRWVALLLFTRWMFTTLYKWKFSPTAKVPGPWFAGLGSFDFYFRLFSDKNYQVIHERHLQYGPVIRMGTRMVSISDGKLAKELLSTHRYRKPAAKYRDIFQILLPNIFTTADPDFHRQRKRLLMPAFTWPTLRRMEETITGAGTRPLLAKFHALAQNGQPFSVNLSTEFLGLTFDVIMRLAFGESLNLIQDNDSEVFGWFGSLLRYMVITRTFSFLKDKPVPYLPMVHQGYLSKRNVVALALRKIRERQAYLATLDRSDPKVDVPQDVLQIMLDAQDPETGANLNTEQVASEAIVQMVAGTDTTSLALCWTVFAILRHPSCGERVINEVLTEFPLRAANASDIIEYDHVKARLPYLTAVIQESLRVYPPVASSLARVVPKGGLTTGEHFLPAGCTVSFSPYAINRSPLMWSQPEEFVPERWLAPEAEMDPGCKVGTLSFLSGPRACIGRNLALMEIHVTIANLIRHFHWEFAEPRFADLEPSEHVMLHVKDDEFRVKFTPRTPELSS
ncbi:hypothetical protein IWQ60_001275 [Tieghemiomyces parasiticus]|uniref:Cytochrome P450 n=1 Tax=Tieghemiomyces parasiticus TaxID=78921 RepID=A0A9W8AEX2_9FUNG|nr:hypothetical protein IWQ60_001275 [Tieghemiomyces parasiticus]